MSALRILLIGKDGQVGGELVRSLAALGVVTATGRKEVDLTSDDSIRAVVQRVRPQLIVNAAAYTAVDKAESEPELARRINADAVATLAAEAKLVGAAMMHYSTDYVFDGAKTGAYVEDDAPHPLGVYGRTKLVGEQALAQGGIPYFVLRTSWVYGARGRNFLLTILRLAAEKPELRIVDDQIGAPTASFEIADATAAIVRRWMSGAGADAARSGIYHLTAAGETSWYGFAAEALHASGTSANFARLIPIPSAEYPTAAARPKNSRLDGSKLEDVFGVRVPEWKVSLAAVLHQIHSADPID